MIIIPGELVQVRGKGLVQKGARNTTGMIDSPESFKDGAGWCTADGKSHYARSCSLRACCEV